AILAPLIDEEAPRTKKDQDLGREARPRWARPGNPRSRPCLPRRRDGGDIQRSASDAGAGSADGGRRGRRRRRLIAPERSSHDGLSEGKETAREDGGGGASRRWRRVN